MASIQTTRANHALITILLGSFSLLTSGCKKAEESIVQEVTVQAVHPRIGNISEQITADATLAPLTQAAILPKVTAPVRKYYVQRGSLVKAGQMLVTLENSDLEAAALDNKGSYTSAQAVYETATRVTSPEDYTKAQLDLTQAKSELDLNQSIVTARSALFAQGAIPGRDLDTAKATLLQSQAAYDIAKQRLEAVQQVSRKATLENAQGQLTSAKGKYLGAQAQLSYTEIRSPINGVVTDRPFFEGETASAGSPVITVMDTSALLAKLHISQMQSQRIELGTSAEIMIPGVSDPVAAKVSFIGPALDPGSTTVEVWLRIENPKRLLKVGTAVHAVITGRSVSDALLMPSEAIQTETDGTTKSAMVIAADGTARKRLVVIGIQTSETVQVLSGITAADTVITVGAYGLDDGTKVRTGETADEPGGTAANTKSNAGMKEDQ
jgi:HlyD family secretion protein